jgi:tripartite-type tricarboxylate transporter receptor subunit TctC
MNALAIGTRQRSAEFPNIPTFAEALNIPDYEASVWYGLLAPAGTNAQIIHKLAAELSKILEMQKIKDKIAATGSEVSPLNSKEFSAFIQAESKKWGELVKTLGL